MIGRLTTAISVAMVVAGCNLVSPQSSVGSNRACMAENPRFADAWACVRARLAAGDASGASRSGLIEEGDLLADQVRSGKVKEADARRRLDAGLAHEPGY